MAFMHGAQDGQKFMSFMLLGLVLSNGMIPASRAAPLSARKERRFILPSPGSREQILSNTRLQMNMVNLFRSR